ncbi:MAG TPA: AAA family ATPase [Dehalococcoidales bacterium]|nr:AAA family ATPase [Dehalococcoidales bacterium]
MKVIGVTGLNGSGKDEILRYLNNKYGMPCISPSDIVREIAEGEGLQLDRESLDLFALQHFEFHGEGFFLKLVIETIKNQNRPVYGISGIRFPQDVTLLRAAFQQDFLLIKVVVSDDRVRFTRMMAEGSQRYKLTFTRFMKHDRADQKSFRIRKTLQMADAAIINDSTIENLHNEIEKLVKERGIF